MGQRGRPKGSKNKPKGQFMRDMAAEKERLTVIKTDEEREAERKAAEEAAQLPVERKRGRPKGAKGKKKYTMSEKALAARKGTHEIKDPKTAEDIAWNARLIDHIMGIHEIATHADRHDLLSLKSCFVAYLRLCQQNGFTITNLAAYASMGMNAETFRLLTKSEDAEVRAFCAFVKETCSMCRESMISVNKLNPVIGIFWQRNFDGLRNDTEQIQAVQEQDEDYANNGKSYKEKYKNLIGE